jgi:hypothetical protein
MSRRSRSARSRAKGAASADRLNRRLRRSFADLALLAYLSCFAGVPPAKAGPSPQQLTTHQTGCTPGERREALRVLQAAVLRVAPHEVESLEEAVKPGGVLAGWRLSHGLVVIDGAGGAAVDDLEAKDPMPPILLYEPSPASSPAEWLDFDGDDGPYRLVGWGKIAPYSPGSSPPSLPCIAKSEWFVHEAGWHLMDGGMRLTPDATDAPPHSEHEGRDYFWHPRAWDIHFWVGDDGVPAISFHNPHARRGGVRLPEDAFFYIVDGKQQPPPPPPGEE